MCFVWISEEILAIALYTVNRLVFITEVESVYCSVRAEYFIKQIRFVLNPLNAELNPIRHLLALEGARHIVHVSRIRVKELSQRDLTASQTDRVTHLQCDLNLVLFFTGLAEF